MLPPEQKWLNAVLAMCGVAFSAGAIWNPFRPAILTYLEDHRIGGHPAMLNTMVVDRFAIYFWYLFLAATAIAILMSVRYLETEHENHGEYYALMLLSVAGMMCMAAGFDIVLIFIGLELMAISTYVLVGFLRRDRRSNEAASEIPVARRIFLGHFRVWSVVALWSFRKHEPGRHCQPDEPRDARPQVRAVQASRDPRPADDDHRPAVQDRRHPVPPMGSRRLRRRAHQHHRIHVGRSQGCGMGHAACASSSSA